jgi:hypothetical protein
LGTPPILIILLIKNLWKIAKPIIKVSIGITYEMYLNEFNTFLLKFLIRDETMKYNMIKMNNDKSKTLLKALLNTLPFFNANKNTNSSGTTAVKI